MTRSAKDIRRNALRLLRPTRTNQTMPLQSSISAHQQATKSLARQLRPSEVFHWLLNNGYFPESYVLPPCFTVTQSPNRAKSYFNVTRTNNGTKYKVPPTECVKVHFPKSELTDRTFGIIHPHIHNDIALHISRNWKTIVDKLLPDDSLVTAYSFPIPLTKRHPGRLGHLRSGRMIYQFIEMTDDNLVSVAYQYNHLVRADIKNFYPSIYTHSIAWAIHGKTTVRKKENLQNYRLVGNRLDKLFQNASDRCTNGIPIGPAVSDIAAELIAAAIDREFSNAVRKGKIDCVAVRFKDDYRILVKTEEDAKRVTKALQAALKEYNLELSDDKTKILPLPSGLFREWASRYHAIHPRKKSSFSWKQFRELYLGVIEIDRACPGTGVIDRFLADIMSKQGNLKLRLYENNLEKAISMLLMLGTLRIKAFPKIMAIMESITQSHFGQQHQAAIIKYLEEYLAKLSRDEERNKYLISWIMYFLVSNNFLRSITFKPKYKDPITRSIATNRNYVFNHVPDFKIFLSSRECAKTVTMLEHLDIFNPPRLI